MLRDALNELPSPLLLRSFREDPLLDAAVAGSPAGLAALTVIRNSVGEDPAAIEAVAIERTRLLRGLSPDHGLSPACESCYAAPMAHQAGPTQQAETWVALQGQYAHAGFAADRRAAPDYLGNELAFLGFLAGREATAWRLGDRAAATSAAEQQRSFIDAHTGRWIGWLRERVQSEAAHPFWPAVLALAEAHLQMEREYLGELLTDTVCAVDAAQPTTTTSCDGGGLP